MHNQDAILGHPPSPIASTLFTVRETALRLGVSLSSTYALLQAGKLPHFRIGGAIRIAASDIETFLAGCRSVQPDQIVRPTRPRLRHIKLPP